MLEGLEKIIEFESLKKVVERAYNDQSKTLACDCCALNGFEKKLDKLKKEKDELEQKLNPVRLRVANVYKVLKSSQELGFFESLSLQGHEFAKAFVCDCEVVKRLERKLDELEKEKDELEQKVNPVRLRVASGHNVLKLVGEASKRLESVRPHVDYVSLPLPFLREIPVYAFKRSIGVLSKLKKVEKRSKAMAKK